MDLFEHQGDRTLESTAPLAARMRPRSFEEFFGQEHLVGPGHVLRSCIESDQVPSMILWGPPGSGKTTLALLIAGLTEAHFEPISAVGAGVADLRRVIAEARGRLGMEQRPTLLFVDEIHRFNKSQQDVVLPHVESGVVTLIGATTENPSFEVIGPLLSRTRVFTLRPLTDEQIGTILARAAADPERGIGALAPRFDADAKRALVAFSGGDARVALNALELSVASAPVGEDGVRHVTLKIVEETMQRRSPRYDKAGDQHYDTISAFIKSVRGSDPDAAVYWLARMIDAGEDPMFIARRIVILAAEDIGLADPQALSVAVAAQQAVHFVGMPEGRIPLAEATVYLATAPKSNSAYMAIDGALRDAGKTPNEPVPLHLRNPVSGLMEAEGYGEGYRYSHDYDDHFSPMENLPPKLRGRRYYHPSEQGAEKEAGRLHRSRWDQPGDGEPSG